MTGDLAWLHLPFQAMEPLLIPGRFIIVYPDAESYLFDPYHR